MITIEIFLGQHTCDPVVHALGALGHVRPRVHRLDLVMEGLRTDAIFAELLDRLPRCRNKIVLLRFGEDCHLLGKHFWDAADSRADDIKAAAGCFDDDGPECFRQAGVQVDMAPHHDVSDLLVPDGTEELNSILEHAAF